MEIVYTLNQLNSCLENARIKEHSIGFIPTMGALHSGHISLIKKAKKNNKVVVCSIFVNPTQFNNKNDLAKYPRTIEADSLMLEAANCDVLFAPDINEVYPKNLNTKLDFNFNGLDIVMEGEFRPGHFAGMAQVVKRLLDIVNPNDLYMGQKDFQQATIVAHMIKKLKIKTNLIVCEIKREKNGLAKSSRNERLPLILREKAALIYKTIKIAFRNRNKKSIEILQNEAMKNLTIEDFKPEYFRIVDGVTLKQVKDISKHKYVVACVACWVGDVRLIDNKIFKKEN
jgi:pantoate--beta-alanine ligase